MCIEDTKANCGWLLGEVTKRYAWAVEEKRNEANRERQRSRQERLMRETGMIDGRGEQRGRETKVKRKIIAAIKSQDNNESLDLWLTLYNRPISALKHNTQLEVHFSSKDTITAHPSYIEIIPNKSS